MNKLNATYERVIEKRIVFKQLFYNKNLSNDSNGVGTFTKLCLVFCEVCQNSDIPILSYS